ncbi:MAG: hypothetical protein IJZ02_01920 [Clostridia bacterium]|nr:hypothetical protein [Clostridia bacterium]
MFKRLLTAFLVVLMLVPLAACGNDTNPPASVTTDPAAATTTAAPETEPAGPTPDLPEVRYEGTELVFVNRPADAQYYNERWLYAEDYTGDLINDSIYKRNVYIEEKYGVTIRTEESNNPADLVSKASSSNDDLYDVMYESFTNTGSAALAGRLYNIADFGHVDYTKPWWDANSVEGLAYHGKLFAVVCDISLMTPVGQRGIIFNRDLAKENNLEDCYDLVKNNQWTLDKMIEMTTKISGDLDGDQQQTDADLYGFLVESGATSGSTFFLLGGCGVKFIEVTDDGFEEKFMNEKTITILDKIRTFAADEIISRDYLALEAEGSRWIYGRKLFAEDHFLFTVASSDVFDEFNSMEMESEYGMVPLPKYDENQAEYYHYLDPLRTCMSIPATNSQDDIERLSVLLEDMAYKSSEEVLTAFVDTVISLRRARVPELGEMVKLIRKSICYDASTLFTTLNYKSMLATAIETGNAASTFAGQGNVFKKRLANVAKKLDALGE